MENRTWTRELGETIALLDPETQKKMLAIVEKMPESQKKSVFTAYIIPKIDKAESTTQIVSLLEEAKQIGLLAVTGQTPKSNVPFFLNGNLCYIPANSYDKRARAIVYAARRRNSELKANKKNNNNNSSDTPLNNSPVHETVKPRINNSKK